MGFPVESHARHTYRINERDLVIGCAVKRVDAIRAALSQLGTACGQAAPPSTTVYMVNERSIAGGRPTARSQQPSLQFAHSQTVCMGMTQPNAVCRGRPHRACEPILRTVCFLPRYLSRKE